MNVVTTDESLLRLAQRYERARAELFAAGRGDAYPALRRQADEAEMLLMAALYLLDPPYVVCGSFAYHASGGELFRRVMGGTKTKRKS